ncbi:hypothetical protein [Dactylococcopsis salina]|uniref:hypothetical protein n=1 Tax=Dactylococcopsis salina TaxID=292566 RepID=UPI00059DAA3F|nr:hypothetical protein [Dactylococcopsis salina]
MKARSIIVFLTFFVRSWMIEAQYQENYQLLFLQDAQNTLIQMQQEDFPSLCDLYTLIIHPSYEKLADTCLISKNE